MTKWKEGDSLWRWNTRWFLLEKVPEGVISEGNPPLWCLWYGRWLHTDHSLPRLLWKAAKEFKAERHLCE